MNEEQKTGASKRKPELETVQESRPVPGGLAGRGGRDECAGEEGSARIGRMGVSTPLVTGKRGN